MKTLKKILIILIIAATVFTVVKCNRIEDADNIKQEQGEDILPKDDKDNQQDEEEEQNKKEEIEYPIELG